MFLLWIDGRSMGARSTILKDRTSGGRKRLRWLDTVENRLSEEHALIVESLLTDLEIHEEYIARSSVDRPKVIEIVNELLMISKEK